MISEGVEAKWRVSMVVVVVIVIGSLLLASAVMPVAAHAFLSSSDPGNGERLETVPDEITLFYTGDGVVIPEVDITGPDGEDVSGEAYVDPEDSHQVHVPILEETGEGIYIVEWKVLAEDGHTTRGTFFFSVGDEPVDRESVIATIQEGPEQNVPISETGAKSLVLVSLVGVIGMPITLLVAMYPVTRRYDVTTGAIDRRILIVLSALSGLLFVGVLALGFARMGAIDPQLLRDFLSQRLGRVWIAQLIMALGLLIVLALAWTDRLSRRQWGLGAMATGILLAAGIGWTSHSATIVGRLQGFAVDFAHIAGAAVWIGGLIVLGLALPRALQTVSPSRRSAFAAAVIRRFSVLAMAGVTLAIATGFVLAAWHVPSLEALINSIYGTALAIKAGLILVALGLGGLTRFDLLRRLEGGSPGRFRAVTDRIHGDQLLRGDGRLQDSRVIALVRRAIRIELTVLISVIIISGLLTSAPTAALVADQTPPDGSTIEAGDSDIAVTVSILPAETVDKWSHVVEDQPLVIDVWFERNGEPVESDRAVRLLADHGASGVTTEITLEPGEEPGMYSGVHVLPEPGVWELRITGEPDGQFTSEWIDVFAAPAPDEDEDHEHGADFDEGLTLSVVFLLASVFVALVGTVATVREAKNVHWFK